MRRAVLMLVAFTVACAAHRQPAERAVPLGGDGEVHLYLGRTSGDAGRLAFTVSEVGATQADGTVVPLELGRTELGGAAAGQRLLASGRLAPGTYSGFTVRIARAKLGTGADAGSLLTDADPVRMVAPFSVRSGRAVVLHAALRFAGSVEKGYGFAPSFVVTAPDWPVVERLGICANTGSDSVTIFDRRTREVVGVLPTGAAPVAVAIDSRAARAYVALADAEAVDVFDLATAERVGRIRLGPGDRPRDLALAASGTLLVANSGSNTVSFLDVGALLETGRLAVGDDPVAVLVDPSGARAYVVSRRANTLALVDVAARAIVSTANTDAEPIAAAIDQTGSRLVVVHAGSADLVTWRVPELAIAGRIVVGLGAAAVAVDPRTDLLYVGMRHEPRIQVFSAGAMVPVDVLEVEGPVIDLAPDPLEPLLYAVVPSRAAVVAIDLGSRRTVGVVDVAHAPAEVRLVQERR